MLTQNKSYSTTPTSYTLSADHVHCPQNGQQKSFLLSTLSDAPHTFIQPSPSLHVAALQLTKSYLDPLASGVSELQIRRQQDARRKRKRGQKEPSEGQPLKLRRVYVDGFDVQQVWGQVRIVLDAALAEVERTEPRWSQAEPTDNDHGEYLERGLQKVPSVDSDTDGFDDQVDDEVAEDAGSGQDDVDQSILESDHEGFDESRISSLEELVEDGYSSPDSHDDLNIQGDLEAGSESEASGDTFVEDPNGLNDGFFSIDDFNKQSEFLERQDVAGESIGFGDMDDEEIDWHADPMNIGLDSKSVTNGEGDDGQSDVADEEDIEETEDGEDDGPTFGNADLNAPDTDSEGGISGEGSTEPVSAGHNGIENTNDIRYKDFFAPPARKSKGQGHSLKQSNATIGRPSKQKVQFDLPAEDDIQSTMDAVRRDLFEDDQSPDDNSETEVSRKRSHDSKKQLSSHERRQARLAEEIRQLEAANVAKKEWTLSGEARAADRPVNSLLEQDLDFERTGKPVPVITAEVSESIEEMIKRRIIAQEFDEVIRRRPDSVMDAANVRRGRFELEDTKPQQSLAEIYEKEHMRQIDPEGHKDERSEKLRKEHEEIEMLWRNVSFKLDALSNWHYKPKPPKPSINIVADVPTVAIEDARPTAAVGAGGDLMGASMLAPQEVYAPGQASAGVGEVVPKGGAAVVKDEMSKEDKERRRRREKERLKKKLGEKSTKASAGRKAVEEDAVVSELKRGGVKIIGRKGEVRDMSGKDVKETKQPRGSGGFKL